MLISNLSCCIVVVVATNTVHCVFVACLSNCLTLEITTGKSISSTLRAHIDPEFLPSNLLARNHQLMLVLGLVIGIVAMHSSTSFLARVFIVKSLAATLRSRLLLIHSVNGSLFRINLLLLGLVLVLLCLLCLLRSVHKFTLGVMLPHD